MSDTSSSPMKIRRFTPKTMSELDSPKIIKRPSGSKVKSRRESNCPCCDEVKKEIQAIRNQQSLQGQMKFLVEAMAEQKVILKQVVRQQVVEVALNKKFPLNDEINSENRHLYINAINSIIQPEGILKNLKNILSTEIVVKYNVNGIHGKRSYKSLTNFYSVILESVPITANSESSEAQIRKAVNLQKKRHFKKMCVEKKSTTLNV